MLKSKAKLLYQNEWVIAKCDESLWSNFHKQYCTKNNVKLQKIGDFAHISIIRGKEELIPPFALFSKSRKNNIIEFEYSEDMEIRRDGFVWIRVFSEQFSEIRKECGFHPDPVMPYHLTIGRFRIR